MTGLFTKESALATLKNKKEKAISVFNKAYDDLMVAISQAKTRRIEIKGEISDLSVKIVNLETEESEVYLFEEEVKAQAEKIKAIIG